MSAVSSVAAQQKFTNLRKRLDQLGYRQPLGIESLPLVEKLFADLIHTTDSLKKAKLQPSKGSKDQGGFEAQIEPYKSDNAKLVKENNDLHQQLIRIKEEGETNIRDLKASLRKIEHENADLKFLNNQYVHKIRQLEKESKQKSDKILDLQEKNFHAVVQTPGGRKKNIPFRRQRMELDSTVPSVEGNTSTAGSSSLSLKPGQAEDPYVADLLRVADDNIAKLRDETDLLREEKEALQGKIENFRKQVETRDNEVDRLTRLLEGGRPYDVVALEARNRSNERLISHLNIQIDYLQQKNQDLQRQVDTALDTARLASTDKTFLDSRNLELSKELKDVDYMAKQLQVEKETVLRAADREIEEAKMELEKSRSELETMDYEVAQLRAEKERLVGDCSELKGRVVSDKADKQRTEDLLAKIQEDKKRLGQRVNKLITNEKELVLEIDRLKHKNGMVKKRGKSPNRMDQFMRTLEEERDYWKGEVEVLQKLLKTRSTSRPSSRPSSRASSPTRSRSLTNTPTKNKSRSSSPSNTARQQSDNKGSLHFEAIIRVLEDERDHYKRECDVLKSMRSRPASPTRPASRASKSGEEESELTKVRQERDELQLLLDKFERHMAEIQANVKVLTSERDKLNAMYDETKEELTRLRREVVRSPKSPKTSLAAQAVLRRVENERDDAIAELRRLTTERDTLRERLKIATETQLAERARLEQKLEDLETALHSVEIEKGTLEDRLRATQRFADTLELQVKDQAIQIVNSKDDIVQNKATSEQMRLLAENAERSSNDSQSRLLRREADLKTSQDHIHQLETRISELQRTSLVDQDEIRRLRNTIASLDREKDGLQIHVDERVERVVTLEEDLTAKERMISELRANITELEAALDRARGDAATKEREISSLRRQLDGTSEELTEVGRGREVALRENRRLQDDLATMTRENQNISQDLQDLAEEKDHLKNQVQDYIVEVKRAEELISSKEQERTDLLEQYRSLSLEAERYETQTHQLESEGSNMRLELMTRDSEIRRLKEKIDTLDREIHQHQHTEQGYEAQVSGLTRSVANLEDSLRNAENERHSILQDLQAVRDLCARLEATKDNLQRQLTGKSLDHEKLQTLLDDMKHETDMLRTQVSSERTSVKNLEDLLQTNREKEFSTQLNSQEKDAELMLYRDRLVLNESKLESHTRELTTLRGRSIELESELERTRRQLTSERFERERAVQELRRNGIAPPGESRLSRTPVPSPLTTAGRSRSPGARSPGRRSPYTTTRSALDDSDDPLASNHTDDAYERSLQRSLRASSHDHKDW